MARSHLVVRLSQPSAGVSRPGARPALAEAGSSVRDLSGATGPGSRRGEAPAPGGRQLWVRAGAGFPPPTLALGPAGAGFPPPPTLALGPAGAGFRCRTLLSARFWPRNGKKHAENDKARPKRRHHAIMLSSRVGSYAQDGY